MQGEFLQSIFTFYASARNVAKMVEVSEQLCAVFKAEFGEQSEFYADALYLNAKALFASA